MRKIDHMTAQEAKHNLRFEFLKLSDKYLKCCENGGSGPLAELYQEFGDVRDISYEQWKTGKVTSPNNLEAFHCKKALSAEDAAYWMGDGADDDGLVVICNTGSTITQLTKSFAEILKVHIKKKTGERAEDFESKFPIGAKVHVPALTKALAVYKMRNEIDENGKRTPYYDIGLALNISEKILTNEEGETGRKDKLKSTARRLYVMAEKTIANIEKGQFP
ncbi:hypothetical protein RugamoR64_33120 [Duganella rhizosphaerae]|uniref:hypothetical protein n=1 Tax=Duganella rhizosphaerae TaxID=2885763 RepID=UPI0030E96CD3